MLITSSRAFIDFSLFLILNTHKTSCKCPLGVCHKHCVINGHSLLEYNADLDDLSFFSVLPILRKEAREWLASNVARQ